MLFLENVKDFFRFFVLLLYFICFIISLSFQKGYIFLKKDEHMSKKILTIQDISCYGNCSTTVALSVLPSFGIETAILPSAIPVFRI